jgi:DeoR family glycerol-3-phosphate regulon repressor
LRDFDYREVKVSQAILTHAREVWLAADPANSTARPWWKWQTGADRPAFHGCATARPVSRLAAEAHVRCDVSLA